MKAEVLEMLRTNVNGCGIPACVSFDRLVEMMGSTTEIQLNPMDRDQVATVMSEIPFLFIDCTEEEYEEAAAKALLDMTAPFDVDVLRQAWDADPDNDFGNPWLVLLAKANKQGVVEYWLAQEIDIC